MAFETRQRMSLEQVQQYVYRAEEHLVHQITFIAALERQGFDKTKADKTLENFRGTLHAMRESLKVLRNLRAGLSDPP